MVNQNVPEFKSDLPNTENDSYSRKTDLQTNAFVGSRKPSAQYKVESTSSNRVKSV